MMPSSPSILLLLAGLILIASPMVLSKPLRVPSRTAHLQQQPLLSAPDAQLISLPHQHLAHMHINVEEAPMSVGLLLTTPDSPSVLHVWLPFGRTIWTRTSAFNPQCSRSCSD